MFFVMPLPTELHLKKPCVGYKQAAPLALLDRVDPCLD